MAIWNRKKRGRKFLSPDGLNVVQFPPSFTQMLNLYGLHGSYGYIYRTQPNVRTVVDFLAEEAASVHLDLFEKVPTSPKLPTGQIEVDDHPMMELLEESSPRITRHRLWFSTVADIGIYDVAYWMKVRLVPGGPVKSVVRIPPTALIPQRDPLTRRIKFYRTILGLELQLEDLVVFSGYDPELQDGQVSPLETLRRILAEESAAGASREGVWRNAARKDGIIERPAAAPGVQDWTPEAREAFRADWEAVMSGASNTGRTGILEDGMHWVDASWSAKEMEYLGARELTRKECAAVFRVDPALVYASNVPITKDTRTAFYVDRLNPLLTRLSEEVNIQLLPDFEPGDLKRRLFTQFDIGEKLRGSFEENAKVASATVGGPYITVNEQRARNGYPPVEGGDQLFIPLNSIRAGGPQGSPVAPVGVPGQGPAPTPGGGSQLPGTEPAGGGEVQPPAIQQASYVWALGAGFTPDQAVLLSQMFGGKIQGGPQDGFQAPQAPAPIVNVYIGEGKVAQQTAPEDLLPSAPRAALRRRQEAADGYQAILKKNFERQARTIRTRIGAEEKSRKALGQKAPVQIDAVWLDGTRWDSELAKDLREFTEKLVDENAVRAIDQVEKKRKATGARFKATTYNAEKTRAYIDARTRNAAANINAKTKDDVEATLADDSTEELGAVFDTKAEWRSATLGAAFATAFINFARDEGAKQAEAKTKTWVVTSQNSRHPEMNGETAQVGQPFANGLLFPGDSEDGDVEETAGCQCLMDIG